MKMACLEGDSGSLPGGRVEQWDGDLGCAKKPEGSGGGVRAG